jgi:hypothetical protein
MFQPPVFRRGKKFATSRGRQSTKITGRLRTRCVLRSMSLCDLARAGIAAGGTDDGPPGLCHYHAACNGAFAIPTATRSRRCVTARLSRRKEVVLRMSEATSADVVARCLGRESINLERSASFAVCALHQPLVRTGRTAAADAPRIISHAAEAPRAIVPGIENIDLGPGRSCYDSTRIHRRFRRRLHRVVAR